MFYSIELPKPTDKLIGLTRKIALARPTNLSSKNWHETIQLENVNCAAGDFFDHSAVTALTKLEFQKYFTHEIYPVIGIIKNTVTNKFASYPPHSDRVRTIGINFYIESGGNNVETVFYNKHDDLNDAMGGNVCAYESLEELARYCFKEPNWYILPSRQYHSVENIETDRIILSISLLCSEEEFFTTYTNWHPLKDSNLGMSESKSDALDQLGEEGI